MVTKVWEWIPDGRNEREECSNWPWNVDIKGTTTEDWNLQDYDWYDCLKSKEARRGLVVHTHTPVSYTHLDVYKRQEGKRVRENLD